MRTANISWEDRSSQKENIVGAGTKNSCLFQTQQAEILGLDFKILMLFWFLICPGNKKNTKRMYFHSDP